MRKVFSLLLALMLIVSLAVPAFAAETSVLKIKGKSIFDVTPGSQYTDSDLFTGFKNMMPGDTLEQEIQVKNQCWSYDYVKVSFKAVPHDAENPLTYSESFENTDGKDQANVDGVRDEDLVSMKDFLSKLTLTIYDKSDDSKVVYEGPALDAPDKVINLGTIRRNRSVDFMTELHMPIELGNEYANRVGEVDWVFTVEYHNDPSSNPKTGDYIIMAALALLVVSAAALLILFLAKRRKNRK